MAQRVCPMAAVAGGIGLRSRFRRDWRPSGLLAHHCMPHARSDERHSRRIVPAVFQTLQSLKTHLRGLPHVTETLPAYPTIPHMVSQLSPDATKPPTSQSAM